MMEYKDQTDIFKINLAPSMEKLEGRANVPNELSEKIVKVLENNIIELIAAEVNIYVLPKEVAAQPPHKVQVLGGVQMDQKVKLKVFLESVKQHCLQIHLQQLFVELL